MRSAARPARLTIVHDGWVGVWGNCPAPCPDHDELDLVENPENDAVDLSAALRRIGFEVTTELDADRVELTEALRAFTRRSAGADVALVFYAGHGLEMDGVNYLVPVDARLERDVDVRYETVTLDDLLVSTLGARLRLVSWTPAETTRSPGRCNGPWRRGA